MNRGRILRHLCHSLLAVGWTFGSVAVSGAETPVRVWSPGLLQDAAAGAPADALVHMGAAVDAAERSGERWFEAELHRLRGELLVRHDPSHESMAEAAFSHAISKAVEQKARFWELRASVSLARLRVGRGDLRRARNVLAPVYDRFSEGLDLPDLRQAGALLANLSG